MPKTEHNFYTKLKNNLSAKKPIPIIIERSDVFKNLIATKIISEPRRGVGSIFVLEQEKYYSFYEQKYPHANIEVKTEADNQKKFRNTKATSIEKDRAIFIRGFQNIMINGIQEDLLKITTKHNIFSAIFHNLKAKKICFVENFQPFLMAEKLLGEDYVYIHFYGRLPKKEILKKIQCEEYLHFGDYDFVGLSEYLRAKEVFNNCKLHVPNHFNTLFDKYATPRKDKDEKYINIKKSTDPDVIKIVQRIDNENNFLEQQILFDEL